MQHYTALCSTGTVCWCGIEEHVEIYDLGEIHWLLGIEIKCNWEHHMKSLFQHSYINSVLCHYGLKDTKPLSTPMDTQAHLSSSQSPSSTAKFAQMHNVPYHEAVGSLMWVLEHNYQRANALNDMLWAYKRKGEGERRSLLTRAHTGRWRLQENKTKGQVCY